ncbi:MAG: SusD/RagB family nutrient-binding outer membrane lipoprotein [Chitinophagaceae bacterium]|nr:SusD/RagB family nutrient-binding outer membrane lipoprotein [Chitinophagaceae bacterium]
MRNHIFKYILIGLCGFGCLTGCKKFVESGNPNTNPNQPSFVTLNTLLPAVEYYTANNQGNVGYITSMLCQQMAAYTSGPISEDQYREVRISTGYSTLYLNALTNAKIMLELARSLSSPRYMAMARVLFVTNLSLATDTWGDVPLSDAFQSPKVLYPHYDKQQDIYDFMQKYLDSAIAEIGQTNPANYTPGVDDLIYGGSVPKWTQAAWFLKARLYMHTTKKGAVDAANNALTALTNGFTGTASDYQLVFSDKNPNPWYANVSGRISASAVFTIAPSKRFMDALTGAVYPGLFDPRIDTLTKKAAATAYGGIVNGAGAASSNNNFTDATYYGRKAAPLVIGSYSEQKLMEAEARFLVNGGTAASVGSTQAAYDAYRAGVFANLAKLGYDSTYGKNALVSVGAANLTLELILREKQVALFVNPEAWVDVRRWDYDPTLFRGMALPLNIDASAGNSFIRRALYPLDEISRNPNASAAVKPITEKVWWDQ